MAQFRKKPIVITAEQYTGSGPDPAGVFRRPEDDTPYVVTIHDQRCYLSPGDWVVPEPDGVHYYPIKPDIFAATYEPAESVPVPVERRGFNLAYHMDVMCNEDGGIGVLAFSLHTDLAIVVLGAPKASPLMQGPIPSLERGFAFVGTEAIKHAIAILQESLREIAQAGGGRG